MTKRALSLLLTLVMVLSLCVPALAAEDFEAEAPAEVVEEAPEAPEAPAAPEAEEPADEPVVDEPAAEEPVEAVADEPEMASIAPEEEEDLPYLVALGVISKKSHYVLEKALEIAEPMKAKADAHEVYGYGGWGTLGQATTTSRTALFDKAYAEAQRCMDAINGLPYTGDVSDKNAEDAATNLLALILVADGGDQTDAKHTGVLTDEVSVIKGATEAGDIATVINAQFASGTKSAYQAKTSGGTDKPVSLATTSTSYKNIVKKLDDWKSFYRENYLTELKDAVTLFDALTYTSTYANYAKAVDALEAALKLEVDASKPNATDTASLQAAVTTAQAAVDENKANKWVGGTTFLTNLKNAVDNANANILGNKTETGMTDGITYKDYKNMESALALKPLTETIQLEKTVLNYNATGDKIASVTLLLSKSHSSDGYDYAYSYTVDGINANISSMNDQPSAFTDSVQKAAITSSSWVQTVSGLAVKPATTDATRDYINITLHPVYKEKTASTAADLTTASNVHVYFYRNIVNGTGPVNGSYSADSCKDYTISLADDYYNGPVIKSVTVSYGDTSVGKIGEFNDTVYATGPDTSVKSGTLTVTVNLNEAFTATYLRALPHWGETDADNPGVVVALLDSDGKIINSVVGHMPNSTPILDQPSIDITVPAAKYSKIVTGDMKVEVRVLDGESTTAIPHDGCTAYAKMQAMDQYDDMATVKAIVAKANAMQKDDYKFGEYSGSAPNFSTYDVLWNNFQAAIDVCEADLAATTKVKTPDTIGTVNSHLWTLLYLRDCMTKNTANIEAMLDALEDARDLKDDDYSYQSWGRLQVAIDDAEDIEKSPSNYLQSKVDAVTAELKAAMAALGKEVPVDKTALNAAIAKATALKEEDYTPESWAANETAIANALKAAQDVAANEKATQAAVTAAADALNSAIAKLVAVEPEKPEGPKAPASGTGWNYYNNEWYFFKNGKLVSNYWVGKIDGASQWDSNWYYVGADGKMLTGMQYLDDLHGGYGWYFLQPTNTKQEIGKMLKGYQWVGGQYGECYFSTKSGSEGKCTWSELLGNWNGTTWVK